MQSPQAKAAILTLLAYLAFLIAWGGAQALQPLGVTISLSVFVFVYVGLTGIGLPFQVAAALRLPMPARSPRGELLGGIGALAIALLIGVFGSDALPLIAANPPDLAGVIKYLLLFLPMGLGISLMCFDLIPRTVQVLLGEGWPGRFAAAVAAGLAIGLGFWVDQLFSGMELAIIQGLLGLLIGLGYLLTRSLALTTLTYWVLLLVNTLSEGKYFGYPWAILIGGFMFSLLMIALGAWRLQRAGLIRRDDPA